MKFDSKYILNKEKIIKLITDYIFNDFPVTLNNINNTKNEIRQYIKNIKLSDEDYNKIEKEILNNILIKNNYSVLPEAKYIINIMNNQQYTIELCEDNNDTVIYFKLDKDLSYLINYDSIDDNWYLSLINHNSLDQIKEIYNNTYENFISYIKEKVAK